MTHLLDQPPTEHRSHERTETSSEGGEKWHTRLAPPILLSDEAFEKFEKAVKEHRPPSDRLRALFARRRKL